MVPDRLRMWFAGDSSVVDVAIDVGEQGASLVLVKPEGGGTRDAALRELKRVAIDSREPARLRARIDELLKGYGRDVRLVLSPATVLRKRWSLPLATEEHLTDVVGFDMDRQTPFAAAQVYYGARVANRDPVREKIDVEVAVIPRSAIDGWLNDLRAAGLSVHGMVSADDVTAAHASINMLPLTAKPEKRWSAMQRLNVGLLMAASLLALAAVVLPIWQKREIVKELMPLATKAGSEYAVTQRVTAEYGKLANEYNFMLAKKHGTYPVVQIVEDLSKAFPDSTWLQTFELKTQPKVKSVELTGEAASVSKVIETLEQTPMFQNTQQRTQTMRGTGSAERFHLASDLKPRPLPEALTTESAAAALTKAAGPNVLGPIPPSDGGSPVPASSSASTPATASVTVPGAPPVSNNNGGAANGAAPSKVAPPPQSSATPPILPGAQPLGPVTIPNVLPAPANTPPVPHSSGVAPASPAPAPPKAKST